MKQSILLLAIFAAILLATGCAHKPPNKPVCYPDGIQTANCTYMVSGPSFRVNNTGSQYTLDGHNWNFDQLMLHSLWMPPETYADVKTFLLNYCHANPGSCNYVQVQKRLSAIETERTLLIQDLNSIIEQ